MMPVSKVAEPSAFNAEARLPGNAWLAANPNEPRPTALWAPYTAALGAGFAERCGYTAMYDPTGGTVDHYLSVKHHRHLSYEWSNYRFASAPSNVSKQNADDEVLDPYEVGEGWFEIILPSLQLQATERVPVAYRVKAEHTLERLKLRDGERIIRQRRAWYRMYRDGKLTLEGLRQVAPLIAAAVAAQANPARP